jgi:hypothetical protein
VSDSTDLRDPEKILLRLAPGRPCSSSTDRREGG